MRRRACVAGSRLGLAVVRGRSMEPTLYDGDRLLVRHGAPPRAGAWSSYACRTGWSRSSGPTAASGGGWWVERDNPRRGRRLLARSGRSRTPTCVAVGPAAAVAAVGAARLTDAVRDWPTGHPRLRGSAPHRAAASTAPSHRLDVTEAPDARSTAPDPSPRRRPRLRPARRRQDGDRLDGRARRPRRPLDGLHARVSRGCARRSPPTRRWSTTTPGSRTPSRSSPTAPRCSASATSARAAAMPVMEGKAVLFKQFGGVDAVPICLDTTDVDEIVETVVRLAPSFGGINLEDISAPRCFEIEERLKDAARHPGLPRRPARHRRRRARRARERAAAHRPQPRAPPAS